MSIPFRKRAFSERLQCGTRGGILSECRVHFIPSVVKGADTLHVSLLPVLLKLFRRFFVVDVCTATVLSPLAPFVSFLLCEFRLFQLNSHTLPGRAARRPG